MRLHKKGVTVLISIGVIILLISTVWHKVIIISITKWSLFKIVAVETNAVSHG